MPLISTAGKTDHLKRPGFSLVEILVVVAIMSLGIGVFLGVNFNQRQALLWRTKLREFQVGLRAARSQAILHRGQNDLVYYPEAKICRQTLSERRVELGEAISFELNAAQQEKLEAARQAADADQEVSLVLFSFYPDGGAAGAPLILRSGRRRARLLVDPLTGSVSLEEDIVETEPVE